MEKKYLECGRKPQGEQAHSTQMDTSYKATVQSFDHRAARYPHSYKEDV